MFLWSLWGIHLTKKIIKQLSNTAVSVILISVICAVVVRNY